MSVPLPTRSGIRELKALANYFSKAGELRNYCLVVLGPTRPPCVSDLQSAGRMPMTLRAEGSGITLS